MRVDDIRAVELLPHDDDCDLEFPFTQQAALVQMRAEPLHTLGYGGIVQPHTIGRGQKSAARLDGFQHRLLLGRELLGCDVLDTRSAIGHFTPAVLCGPFICRLRGGLP